jgi:hypothetical protein
MASPSPYPPPPPRPSAPPASLVSPSPGRNPAQTELLPPQDVHLAPLRHPHLPQRAILTPTHYDQARSAVNCARVSLGRLLDCTDKDLAALFGFCDGPLPRDTVRWFQSLAEASPKCRYGHQPGPMEPKTVARLVSVHGIDQRFYCDLVWGEHLSSDGSKIAGGGHAVVIERHSDGGFATRDYQRRANQSFPPGKAYHEYNNVLLPGFQQGTLEIRDLYWLSQPREAKDWIRPQILQLRARQSDRCAIVL